MLSNYLLLSQVWLPTVQDVLQADWQDVWHSPHPPLHIVGVLYCLFFGVIRVGMGQAFVTDTTAFFTMMLYCAAGGMLGGMLS